MTDTPQAVAQVDDPADRNIRIGGDFDTSTDDPSFRLEATEDAASNDATETSFVDDDRRASLQSRHDALAVLYPCGTLLQCGA